MTSFAWFLVGMIILALAAPVLTTIIERRDRRRRQRADLVRERLLGRPGFVWDNETLTWLWTHATDAQPPGHGRGAA